MIACSVRPRRSRSIIGFRSPHHAPWVWDVQVRPTPQTRFTVSAGPNTVVETRTSDGDSGGTPGDGRDGNTTEVLRYDPCSSGR